MQEGEKGNTYRYEFESWGEFLDYLKQPHKTNSRCSDSHGGSLGAVWSGTKDFDDALKLATEGWQEGCDKIKKLTAGFVDKLASLIEVQEPVYDVEGSGFDVALVLEGVPEHWVRFETDYREGAGRIVKIRLAASCSGGTDTSVIFARGAVMAALVELLELAGHRCEVYVNPVDASSESPRVESSSKLNISTSVLFKAADQPLDMARLAFAYCNGATLRRFGFYLMEIAPPKYAKLADAGYSYAADSPASAADADLYLGVANHWKDTQWANPETARAWILARLKELGVALTDED